MRLFVGGIALAVAVTLAANWFGWLPVLLVLAGAAIGGPIALIVFLWDFRVFR